MYTKDEILARLNAGENIEVIAKEMTQILNDAQAAKQKADDEAKAAEAKRKAEEMEKAEREKRMIADSQEIASYIRQYIVTYFPDYKSFLTDDELAETVRDSIKTSVEFCNIFPRERKEKRAAPAHSDPLTDFLKNFGLL